MADSENAGGGAGVKQVKKVVLVLIVKCGVSKSTVACQVKPPQQLQCATAVPVRTRGARSRSAQTPQVKNGFAWDECRPSGPYPRAYADNTAHRPTPYAP